MSELLELENKLEKLAQQVVTRLEKLNKKVVFAESCTGGKMAAAMTMVPGVSSSFCGSAVTYRNATKTQWLDVAESDLEKHTAVSKPTTVAMARNVLAKTTEADYSVAITGHLGPEVEPEIDGKIFVVAGQRDPAPFGFVAEAFQLESFDRKTRQTEAACFAFKQFLIATG